MSSPSTEPSRTETRRATLIDVLLLRQDEDPDPARAALIDELIGGAVPPVLNALAQSTPDEAELGEPTPPHRIADILHRAAELTARPANDAVADWMDQLRRLLASSGRELHRLSEELRGLGFVLNADDTLAAILTARPLVAHRELLRAVVILTGGDWTGGGWETLYDAAIDEQADLNGTLNAIAPTRVPSGLGGAELLAGHELLTQVRPPVENLPTRLHGREEERAQLHALLDEPATTIHLITGKGGVGKSTVALAIMEEAHRRAHHVWWVDASDPNQVTRGMLAVATNLGAPLSELNAIQSEPRRGVEMLWQRLHSSHRPWLLVFDGADDPDVLSILDSERALRWFRPSDAGTVLITTRVVDHLAWGEDTHHIEINDLSPASGALVILDRLRPSLDAAGRPCVDSSADVANARELSIRLGGVALALRNVGDYLASNVTRHSLAELVSSLDARRLADTHVASPDPRSRIATTWELSLDALASKGLAEARPLLRLLACFAPGRWVIPLDMLAPEHLAATGMPSLVGGPAQWKEAMDGLCAVGLIDRKRTAGQRIEGVAIHPLVAEVSLDAGGKDDDAIEAAAVALLWRVVANLDGGRPADWPALRRLEPHVYAVVEAVRSEKAHIEALRLANRTAVGLIQAGLFALGEKLIRLARALTHLGPEDPDVLATEHALAWALGLRGDLTEAARRLTALVDDLTRISGPDDPSTLLARDHLAWVLAEQGRLDLADRMLRELLAEYERHDNATTVAALAVRHRLAWVAALRGHLDEAEREFRDVLPLRREALGKNHMEVFSTRYRLGWSIAIQGRVEEAESVFAKLYTDVQQVLTSEAAPVIMVKARLGYVRAMRGKFNDAERHYREVLEARHELLGPDHPRTLRARHDLAWVLAVRGDWRGAERGYRDVLSYENQLLGRDHPLTLETRGRLAGLLISAGRLDEAHLRLTALVSDRRRTSGCDHQATLITRYNLGLVLLARGHYSQAAPQLEAVLDDQLRVLGPAHRHVLYTRATLAKVHGRLGNLATAQEQIADVRDAATHQLGRDHPETLATRQVLVWVLGEQHELERAERECRALLAHRLRVIGGDHPDSLDTLYRLGWILGLGNRGGEAAQIYRSLLHRQQRALGPDHPHTMRTAHGIAHELLRAGRLAKAEQELRDVLLERTRTLGRHHPDTLSNRHTLAFAQALSGKHEEAGRQFHDVLHDQLHALGADHRDTLNTRERLAWLQEQRGAAHDAAKQWRWLLTDHERVLGVDHPDTRRVRQRLASHAHTVDRIW